MVLGLIVAAAGHRGAAAERPVGHAFHGLGRGDLLHHEKQVQRVDQCFAITLQRLGPPPRRGHLPVRARSGSPALRVWQHPPWEHALRVQDAGRIHGR